MTDVLPKAAEALHPIALDIMEALVEHPDGTLSLPNAAVEELAIVVRSFVGTEALPAIAMTLSALQQSLAAQGSTEPAEVLAEILRQRELVGALKAYRVSGDPDAVKATAKRFSDFAAADAPAVAPAFGEEKPKGAKSLNDLGFPIIAR